MMINSYINNTNHIDDHFAFEHGHEVLGFFSHSDVDLNWFSSMFLVQIHGLERHRRHLVLRGMASLK